MLVALLILLLSADTGVQTTRTIITKLKEQFNRGEIQEGKDLQTALADILLDILKESERVKNITVRMDSTSSPRTVINPSDRPELVEGFDRSSEQSNIYLLVGINGSGKTTFAAKLAHKLSQEGKKVLLIAADTFRAAALEQLTCWAEKTGTDIVLGTPQQDPASVVFQGCEKFKQENFDALIIDTAGRLQTKVNLMKELEKIKKVIHKHLPDAPINTLLTIDAMLGQNSFNQAQLFNESTDVTGVVLTKMDGTGKGGIVFGIAHELNIPVAYISFGEQADQMRLFNAQEYVQELLEE